MSRHLRLLMLLLLSACNRPQGELATIEDAEAYAQTHGVALAEKRENTDQRVAQRAYRYITGPGINVSVLQFASADAAATWKKTMDSLPLGREIRIQKGPVAFAIWGATDAERQKVVDALQ